MSQTIFISDLHLEINEPDITQKFLNFLQHQAIQADALYILGDFFEVWIGDDDRNEFNEKIKTVLKNFTAKGTPTYFMRGNRDFLIGKKFCEDTGCQLLKDPTLINLYGVPTLLVHGDSLCTQDTRHQKFRKIVNNAFIQNLFFILPLSWRRKIARNIREQSKKHSQKLAQEITDVTPTTLENLMKAHKARLLIHGHTHRPGMHTFNLNGQAAKRIVLGAWHDSGNIILICQPDKEPELTSQH